MKKLYRILAAMFVACTIASVSFAQVLLNEAYSRGVVGNLDWVEVYNNSASVIDISGYKVYDDGGQSGSKDKKPFPAGTLVPAYGFAVIVTDTATVGLNDKFGLSSTGDKVWLENTSGVLLDSVIVPALGNDTSVARQTDGSASWVKLSPVTRGTTNSQVVMNEVYSRGVVGALDWIEIYNASDGSIDISGYKIYDDGGQSGSKDKKPFPAGTVVPAHGFTVIVTDTATVGLNDKFGLSSTGDKIWLENAGGIIIDSVAIPALGIDTSYARKPDGSATWVKMSPTTKSLTNGTGTAVREEGSVATRFTLEQNYPNPFNPSTTIRFSVVDPQFTTLRVYDVLGREVAVLVNEVEQPGQYTVQFNAANLSSGIYFYTLRAGSFVETKKLTVMK